jgi:hypothetical protein
MNARPSMFAVRMSIMQWELVTALAFMCGCATRPLEFSEGCQVGDPMPISDDFSGAELDLRCWSSILGSVGLEGGALRVEAGRGYNLAEMATRGVAVADFMMYARVKVAGADATSSLAIGWRGPHTAAFMIPIGMQAPVWHALVDNEERELSRSVTAGADFSDLEIRRAGATLSYLIDGELLGSFNVLSDFGDATVRVSAAGAGTLYVDSIALR